MLTTVSCTRLPTKRSTQAGLTLIELLVSLTLSVVVMGALYTALIGFSKFHTDQSLRTELEQELRASFDLMSRDLTSAGYGLINNGNADAQGVIFANSNAASDTATTNSMTIWLRSVSTLPKSVLTADMLSNTSYFRVANVAGFTTTSLLWAIGSCVGGGVNRSKITVTTIGNPSAVDIAQSTTSNCIHAISANVLALNEISYQLNGTTLERQEDRGGWKPIMSGVTALTIQYYDNNNTALSPTTGGIRQSIRRVRITLAARTSQNLRDAGRRNQGDGSRRFTDTVTYTSDVSPRNLVALGV